MKPWEIHPILVHFPIAFLLGGVAVDLFAWWRRNDRLVRLANGLLLAGVLAALATAGAGVLAYFTVPGHAESAERWMKWHPVLAVAAVLLFALVVILRWRRPGPPANWTRVVLVFATALFVTAASFGGSLVYRGGAGVDREILRVEPGAGHHTM